MIDVLSLWLSVSVLLSWVMNSKYFFPVPNIPIRPGQLLTIHGGDAGALGKCALCLFDKCIGPVSLNELISPCLLGKYGINVGPMVISWSFRFFNGKVEAMIGRAMADALNRQKRREKEEMKRIKKEVRAKEKEARRVAREHAKLAKHERMTSQGDNDECSDDTCSDGENSYSGMTASNVIQNNLTPFDTVGSISNSMEDLD